MKIYSIYVNEDDRDMSPDYIKVTLEQKSLLVQLIGPMYFLTRGMWKFFLLFSLIEIFLLIIGIKLIHLQNIDVLYWIISMHIGFSWLYSYFEINFLEKQGYIFKQAILGSSEDEAIMKYINRFKISN